MIKMMIVEDEPWIRKGIEHVLPWADLGIQYMGFAKNGEEGLKLVDSYQPEIILTDIKMPIMDGIQFIKKLRETEHNFPKVIILTGYNDFTYAKEAIKYGVSDYILKPIDSTELLGTITKLVNSINEEKAASLKVSRLQLANYLYEQILNPTDGANQDLLLPSPYYSFLISNKKFPEDLFVLNDQISDCFYFQMGHSIVYTLCFHDEVSPFFIVDEEISTLPDEYTIGVSNLYSSDRYEVIEAYQEAQYHLQQNLREGSRFGDQLLKRTYLKEEQEKELLSLLQLGDKQKSYQYVMNLLDSCSSFEEKLVIHFQLFTLLGRYLDHKQNLLDESNYLHKFKIANCHEDVQQITEDIIFTLIDYIINDWNQSPSEMGKLAKAYIDEHYMNPSLSLSMVAEQLNLSPSYLSHIFKDELNVNFISYVTDKRILKAKEKLIGSKQPIYLISEKVGFNDPKYFNRVFKRQTGITPKHYREINGGNIAL
jgi:two-component system, response regulator YesN